MSVKAPETDVEHEEWGDGRVVSHWGDETGNWIMYDPEDDLVDVKDWR